MLATPLIGAIIVLDTSMLFCFEAMLFCFLLSGPTGNGSSSMQRFRMEGCMNVTTLQMPGIVVAT